MKKDDHAHEVSHENFYHIVRTSDAQDFFAGQTKIEWNGDQLNQNAFDLDGYRPTIAINGSEQPIISTLPDLKLHYEKAGLPIDLLTHFSRSLTFANRRFLEEIFEQVRKAHFNNLPSRRNCIFLTDKKHLGLWYNALTQEEDDLPIYELNCSGIAFSADANWIDSEVDRREVYENSAFAYWGQQSKSDNRFERREVLFRGTLIPIASYPSLDVAIKDRPIELDWTKLNLSGDLFDCQSELHGVIHTYRVMILAYKIGLRLGQLEKAKLAACAAFLHDTGRTHDGPCTVHGELAAKKKLPLFRDLFFWFGFSKSDLQEVETAIIHHCYDQELYKNHPHYTTLAILKDADALDRIRFGVNSLDRSLLRFNVSQELIEYSHALFRNSATYDSMYYHKFFESEMKKNSSKVII